MAHRRGWTAPAIVAAVILAASPATHAAEPVVVLYIDDYAHVPARALDNAKTEVERIYRQAGVVVTWAEGPLAPAVSTVGPTARFYRRLAVILVNGNEAPACATTDCALGEAARVIGRAYVYYDRIVSVSQTRPVDTDATLAQVIAHETGHLLLPPDSHARVGIMQASFDFSPSRPHCFTDDEAASIRTALAN
jgi:hypothetical protein